MSDETPGLCALQGCGAPAVADGVWVCAAHEPGWVASGECARLAVVMQECRCGDWCECEVGKRAEVAFADWVRRTDAEALHGRPS